MTQLGLTEAEQKLAMIDPGFTGAGITTRLDGFIHGREINLSNTTRKIHPVFPIKKG